MKKAIFYFVGLLLFNFSALGQWDSCQSHFNYQVNGSEVSFTNNSIGGQYVQWDFGDGHFSYVWNPTHNFSPGLYLTCLTIYSDTIGAGCVDTFCDSIYIEDGGIDSSCFAAFDFDVDGQHVQFTNLSQPQENLEVLWDLGFGVTLSIENPLVWFPGPGSYEVCLNITDTLSQCQSQSCQTVVINQQDSGFCCVGFEADFDAQVNNYTASFTNTSSEAGIQTSYFWTFGDGAFSTDENPVHTYNLPGVYEVCLIAQGASCIDSVCYTIDIICGNDSTFCDLNADFQAFADSGQFVFFDNQTSGAGAFTGYIWSFGDGNYSNEENPVHFYSSPGQYYVCLQAYEADGVDTSCYDQTCKYVTVGNISDPCLGFEADFSAIDLGDLTVLFQDQSAGVDGFTYYNWSFGDGSFSVEENPIHTYAMGGIYNVCLEIYNHELDSCFSVFCETVVLASSPCDYLIADYEYQSNGLDVSFNDLSSGVDSSTFYFWRFGDGETESGYGLTNPNHTYSFSGSYSACLTVYNFADSCEDTRCMTVFATEDSLSCNLEANFEAFADSGLYVFFNNTTAGADASTSYLWSFGDGSFSFYENPFHLYSAPGTYLVCLTAQSAEMDSTCIDQFCQYVTVGDLDSNGAVGVVDLQKEELVLNLFPNPVNDVSTLNITSGLEGLASVEVFNAQGQQVQAQAVALASGENRVELNTNDLPNGYYTLIVTASGGAKPSRVGFVKSGQ